MTLSLHGCGNAHRQRETRMRSREREKERVQTLPMNKEEEKDYIGEVNWISRRSRRLRRR
jgi:hypothetical protein